MIRNILITLISFTFICIKSFGAADIVYPSSDNININSNLIFFSGSTNDKDITINSDTVKLWENKFFVHIVPLEYGKNIIKIKSTDNGVSQEKIYTVTRNKPSQNTVQKNAPQFISNQSGILYTKTIKPNATLRDKPSTSSNRIIDLPKDIILYLEGRQGDYYKIKESADSQLWIHKTNIDTPVQINNKLKTVIENTSSNSDKVFEYTKIKLTNPILYTIKQNNNTLKLTLYGIYNKENDETTNAEFLLDYKNPQLGYDCYYEGNTLIIRKAKLNKSEDEQYPLKGINIFIDAGHGGNEKGTISPERVYEKDINLDIALDLIDMLKKAGANVSYSRTNDTKVGLYERMEIAKKNNALISLSIHCNSLPLGKNPYEKHGTEVHYYNDNAKMLAQIINKNLANDLSIKNGGIYKSSFAMTRPTLPVSVLIETAYMIYPNEYILLKNKYFRRNIAKSIKKSLEEYILCLTNNKS